jgi:hypothetical protein
MRRLFLAAALCVGLLVPASSAVAAPTGIYAPFNNCPLSNPNIKACLYSKISSGQVELGNKTVPIVNPVIMQAGLEYAETVFDPITVVGGANGTTLTPTPQPVPGGLTGIVAPSWWPKFARDWFNQQINEGFTGVTATMELAGPASSIKLNMLALAAQQGTALAMPVKIKLGNPILGSNCYIGSNSNPIQLKLTTGTTAPPPPNTPISGATGEVTESPDGTVLYVKNNKLVDNSWSAPGANGCGGFLFSWLVDPLVDSVNGTPSAAGNNAAILEGETLLGDPKSVKASE